MALERSSQKAASACLGGGLGQPGFQLLRVAAADVPNVAQPVCCVGPTVAPRRAAGPTRASCRYLPPHWQRCDQRTPRGEIADLVSRNAAIPAAYPKVGRCLLWHQPLDMSLLKLAPYPLEVTLEKSGQRGLFPFCYLVTDLREPASAFLGSPICSNFLASGFLAPGENPQAHVCSSF